MEHNVTPDTEIRHRHVDGTTHAHGGSHGFEIGGQTIADTFGDEPTHSHCVLGVEDSDSGPVVWSERDAEPSVAERVAAGGCNTCHERGGEPVTVDGAWWVVCGGCGDEWTLADWSAPMPVEPVADGWVEMAQRQGRLVRMVGCTLTCGHGGPCAPGRIQSADGCSAETDGPTTRDLLIDAHNVLLRHALSEPGGIPHPAYVSLGGNVEGVQVTFPRGYVLVTVDDEDPDGAPAYLVSVCPGDDVDHDHTEDALTRTTLAHLDWSVDVISRHLSR